MARKGVVVSKLLAWIKKIQKEQALLMAEYERRIIDFYVNRTLKSVNPYVHALELKIEVDPEITVPQIKKTAEYKALIATVSQELDDFVEFASIEIDLASKASIQKAVMDIGLLASVINIDKARIVTPSAMDILLGYLEPGGELSQRIGLWADNATGQVTNSIIEGVGLGRNPVKIGRDIYKAMGHSLSDAVRTTRTVQLWSYRESTRANYIANSDIVKGWIWYAALDERTCMSCINMHGTIHSLEETLNDHHNGRCTMLPLLDGVDYGIVNAREWFDSLGEQTKVKMMGEGKYQAYQDNLFTFDKLTTEKENYVYGLMRSETSLKELLNEQ